MVMRTIAHISDLHFGNVNARVAEALAVELRGMAPDLVVVSGDLTQRARARQYAAAAEYLGGLPGPQIVVPGNHDIPLFDVVRRFSCPLGRFREQISSEAYPLYRDDEMAVLGVNTARSWSWSLRGFWRDGRIEAEQLGEIERRLGGIGVGVVKVVVTHHPFILPPRRGVHGVVGGAGEALGVLRRCGVEVLLAGHFHTSYWGEARSEDGRECPWLLTVQAGSAISTRLRREPNSYNMITIDGGLVRVVARSWVVDCFEETSSVCYEKVEGKWRAMSAKLVG